MNFHLKPIFLILSIMLGFDLNDAEAQESKIKLSFVESSGSARSTFQSRDQIFAKIDFPEKAEQFLYSNYSIMVSAWDPWITVQYYLEVYKGENLVCASNRHSYVRVTDVAKTSLVFDVLSNAQSSTTLATADRKGELSGNPFPLGRLIYEGQLKEAGTYKVKVRIAFVKEYQDAKDWPFVEGVVDFNLKSEDISKIEQNYLETKNKLSPGTFCFALTPFTKEKSNCLSTFKSSESVYGRLELPSSIESFFSLPAMSKIPSSLRYRITVYKDGERVQWGQWFYLRLSEMDRASTVLNFDVLPKAIEATTIFAMVPEFNQGILAGPLTTILTDRQHVPEEGNYTIQVLIAYPTFDPYAPGTPTTEDKWIRCSGEFSIDFKVSDVSKLMALANESNGLVKENAAKKLVEERGLPKEWNMSSSKVVCGYTQEQVNALFLKRFEAGTKIIKTVVFEQKDPMWIVEKNSLDVPLLKYHNQTYGYFIKIGAQYFYVEGYLTQTYEGGGNYGSVYFEWYRKDEVGSKFIEPHLK